MITYSKELEKEINDFKSYCLFNKDKSKREKEHSFNNNTLYRLHLFIDYLNEELHINITEIVSLKEYVKSYLIDYFYYLSCKYNTTTIISYISVLIKLISFYKLNSTVIEVSDFNKLYREYRDEKSLLRLKQGKKAINKEIRQRIELKTIIRIIKKLHLKYQENKNIKLLHDKLLLKVLVHTGWRSMNIRELIFDETVLLINEKWHYNFIPEKQKYPLKNNGVYKTITGIFPLSLQKDLSNYINESNLKKGEYLFKNRKNERFSSSAFSLYIQRLTKKYIGKELNPHVFRDITFTYLIENGLYPIYAQLFLWHKPSFFSVSDYAYFKTDINKACLEANKILKKLYKKGKEGKKKKRRKKKKLPVNVIRFPK